MMCGSTRSVGDVGGCDGVWGVVEQQLLGCTWRMVSNSVCSFGNFLEKNKI